MASGMATAYENDLNLKATELRLGLPGTEENEEQTPATAARNNNKRSSPDCNDNRGATAKSGGDKEDEATPASK